MAVLDYRTTCDLNRPVTIKHLDGMFFSQDVQANRIVVSVVRGGVNENLSGTVSANIIRADGGTVAQAGEIDGNVVTITMPAAAYAIPGAIAVFVKHTQDCATSTLAAVTGYVYKSTTDTIVDPGTIIPSIQDLISSIEDAIEDLEEAIAAIPQDYQDLEDDVSDLKDDVSDLKNGIDSLEGGTTGQVLRKKTGTDFDVEWASVAQPTDAQVDTAVNDWLDDHPEATTTVDFAIATKVFGTVTAMAADLTLEDGDNVATRGYYVSGDNGGANYVVSSSHSGVFYITLENGLYANRLDESGLIPAESIGIRAYASETADPDEDIMENNTTLFQASVSNTIFVLFGKGHFYFDNEISLNGNWQFVIQGIGRGDSYLHFPNGKGLVFSEATYYKYYVIKSLGINSNGNCIDVSESCRALMDSRFEYLNLVSEEGNCFNAPTYNVSKYTSGGTDHYDTCVQNCVFDFVNVNAENGAGFCNIMGMYSYYKHMNIVNCKYAFRNCDGTAEQVNMLGDVYSDYFIYFDKTNSYSLRWTFINVNAEACTKAFIYTEPEVNYATGEDHKKPENANLMGLASLVAIGSSWKLRGVNANHDVYPITVHSVARIEIINSDTLITPTLYPSAYDTSVVKCEIKCLRNSSYPSIYNGGKTIGVISGTATTPMTYYGQTNRIAMAATLVPDNTEYQKYPPHYDAIYSDVMFGGKELDMYEVKASEATLSSNFLRTPDNKRFSDLIVINVDNANGFTIKGFWFNNQGSVLKYPGKIITVVNKSNSLGNLTIQSYVQAGFGIGGLHPSVTENIVLAPSECIHLIATYGARPSDPTDIKSTWKPLFPTS